MITSHCSSGFKHSLKEVLSDTGVKKQIANMSCADENTYLDKFFEILGTNEDKVTYGPKCVEYALNNMAIEVLLISDKLFRSKNIA
mmetsp:Transcript_20801/g.28642  ORF Transcript_20801/g.28642 Transcript_20801/m.28642 type:complete len:86 (+) Transcript_20801:754-1011(+)